MLITGTVKKILTQKENDWGRFELDCSGNTVLAVGIVSGAGVGTTVTLDGNDVTNQYGRQFVIKNVVKVEADKFAGVKSFLGDGYIKGIGPGKAENIVAMFGSESADLFDTEEGREMLTHVKGITRLTIENAMESYEANKKFKPLIVFLNGMGTKGQVMAIFEKYGERAIKVLKDNPYRLQMDLDGFGFVRADTIAMAAGIKPNSPYRIMAAVKFELEEAASKEGHCFLTVDQLQNRVITMLVPVPKCQEVSETICRNALAKWPDAKEKFIKNHEPSAATVDAMSIAWETRCLIEDTFAEALQQAFDNGDLVNDEGRIYTAKMYSIENDISELIAKMLSQPPLRRISDSDVERAISVIQARKNEELKRQGKDFSFEITDEQKAAIMMGAKSRLGIITGGPGRGKTTICEAISEAFLSAGATYDKRDILMLASTGRAAQRIKESTGYSAMTAHRAILESQKGQLKLEGKLVICDEWSMADVYLMISLLKCVGRCNVIFIGDVDQIASVGPGKVLRDMIASEAVPCVMLKKGHRNSGTIAQNAERIRNGNKLKYFTFDDSFKYFGFHEDDKDGLLNSLLNDYIANVKKYGIADVMLCVAMKERGVTCVSKLNNMIQNIMTNGKPEAVYGDKKFRVGDRVMFTKNNYDFVRITPDMKQTLGLFNGERGIVCKILPDPENDSQKMIIKWDDGTIGGLTKNTVVDLALAYATTMHKCQGSEAACVMIANTYADYILLLRSLFYTAVTRSKGVCCIYGEEKFQYGRWMSAFDVAIGKTEDVVRQTMLAERIRKNVR